MSHYLEANEYYHFQIIFKENSSGIVQYKYFDATDGGDSCTIGVQSIRLFFHFQILFIFFKARVMVHIYYILPIKRMQYNKI